MTAQLRRPRRWTRPYRIGKRTVSTIQRYCNGCGRRLGDATEREISLGVVGQLEQTDIRDECPTCTPNPPGLQWTIGLPWPLPPLTLNQRDHPQARARRTREVRDWARTIARVEKLPPLHAMTVELHYVPREQRVRDPLNLTATVKAIEDGLVDAGLVPDDAPPYVTSVMPVIDDCQPGRPGRLYLVVRELHPTTQPTQEGTQ